MSQQLVYTSAPKGLKVGSRGLCTVASTSGMAKNLANRLEALSGYRHVFPAGSGEARSNPVNVSYIRFKLGGRNYYLLSRVADAGLDYTQRANTLAHHVVLDKTGELVQAGPAWLASQAGFFVTEWTSQPRIFNATKEIVGGNLRPWVCQSWADAAGDAGWAGVLAESLVERALPEAYLIYQAGTNVLPLILEAQSLVPPERRWEATFSTYFTKIPPGVDCRWRCVVDNTPEAARARRSPGKLVIDLIGPLPAATGGPLVEVARTGELPVREDAAAATNRTGTTPALPSEADRHPGRKAPSEPARRLIAPPWEPLGPPPLPAKAAPDPELPAGTGKARGWKRFVYAASLLILGMMLGAGLINGVVVNRSWFTGSSIPKGNSTGSLPSKATGTAHPSSQGNGQKGGSEQQSKLGPNSEAKSPMGSDTGDTQKPPARKTVTRGREGAESNASTMPEQKDDPKPHTAQTPQAEVTSGESDHTKKTPAALLSIDRTVVMPPQPQTDLTAAQSTSLGSLQSTAGSFEVRIYADPSDVRLHCNLAAPKTATIQVIDGNNSDKNNKIATIFLEGKRLTFDWRSWQERRIEKRIQQLVRTSYLVVQADKGQRYVVQLMPEEFSPTKEESFRFSVNNKWRKLSRPIAPVGSHRKLRLYYRIEDSDMPGKETPPLCLELGKKNTKRLPLQNIDLDGLDLSLELAMQLDHDGKLRIEAAIEGKITGGPKKRPLDGAKLYAKWTRQRAERRKLTIPVIKMYANSVNRRWPFRGNSDSLGQRFIGKQGELVWEPKNNESVEDIEAREKSFRMRLRDKSEEYRKDDKDDGKEEECNRWLSDIREDSCFQKLDEHRKEFPDLLEWEGSISKLKIHLKLTQQMVVSKEKQSDKRVQFPEMVLYQRGDWPETPQ